MQNLAFLLFTTFIPFPGYELNHRTRFRGHGCHCMDRCHPAKDSDECGKADLADRRYNHPHLSDIVYISSPTFVFDMEKPSAQQINGSTLYSPFEIPFNPNPLRTPRRLRLICIGSGFAGLTLAYKINIEKDFGDIIDFQIYERKEDVGGTWLVNKYPGLTCDVPIHIYTLPWAPKHDWTKYVRIDENQRSKTVPIPLMLSPIDSRWPAATR